jgi:hypothetical protein
MFLLVVQALGDGDLCQTCTCTTSDDAHTLTTNCTNRGLHHVPGEWPGKNVTTIRAMFSGNDIPTLEPLALTDAVVEIVLSNCNIQYLRPELFAATKNIKFADLSHNLLLGKRGLSEIGREQPSIKTVSLPTPIRDEITPMLIENKGKTMWWNCFLEYECVQQQHWWIWYLV